MNTDNFEDQIKNAFERHRPEADTDAIWEHIEPRLKKKKKRRFIIFFWMLGLGLLLLLVRHDRWMHYYKFDTAVSSEKKVVGSSTDETTAGNEEETLSINEKSVSDLDDDTAAVMSNYAYASVKSFPDDNDASATIDISENDATRKGMDLNTDHTDKVVANTTVVVNAAQETDTKEKDAPSDVAEEQQTPLPQTAFEMNEDTNKEGVSDTSAMILSDDKSGSDKVAKSKEENDKAVKKEQKDAKKPDRRKKSKKRKSHWEHNLGVQAGPALAIRRLSEGSNVTAPAGLLESRKSTEHTMESFTVGMFYSAATRKGLVLKTGLDCRQSNEKFHLEYYEKETQQVNGVLTVTVDGSGNTISQTTGKKTVTKTTEYSNTVYNHYRYINLPFGIGYRYTAKKIRWELSGGIDINLLFRFDGTIYNEYLQPAPLKYGTTYYNEVFRSSTGPGIWLSYACDWRITDQLRWQLSMNTQMPLHPVTRPAYGLTQRYFNVGAQIGLVYRVKKEKKGK